MNKHLLRLQVWVIGLGATYAWIMLARQFLGFNSVYGTVFKIKDCYPPNPILTPCFYGTIAFTVAVIWALKLLNNPSSKSEMWLSRFLIFGTIFALGVFAYEASFYFRGGSPSFGCTTGPVVPWQIPCLYGGLLFFASYLTSRRLRK